MDCTLYTVHCLEALPPAASVHGLECSFRLSTWSWRRAGAIAIESRSVDTSTRLRSQRRRCLDSDAGNCTEKATRDGPN